MSKDELTAIVFACRLALESCEGRLHALNRDEYPGLVRALALLEGLVPRLERAVIKLGPRSNLGI